MYIVQFYIVQTTMLMFNVIPSSNQWFDVLLNGFKQYKDEIFLKQNIRYVAYKSAVDRAI